MTKGFNIKELQYEEIRYVTNLQLYKTCLQNCGKYSKSNNGNIIIRQKVFIAGNVSAVSSDVGTVIFGSDTALICGVRRTMLCKYRSLA